MVIEQQFPKRCQCCGRTYDERSWAALPRIGEPYDDGYVVLELRNCPCRSTLAVELGMSAQMKEAPAAV